MRQSRRRLLSQTRDKKKVVTARQTASKKHVVLHRVVLWSGLNGTRASD